jgi:RNA polymerase sigma-70 factor (ECF subfamily)
VEIQERFRELVDRYYEDVWRYASQLTGGRHGEDLCHDAFLAAFDRMLAGQEGIRDVDKWLRGTVRHLAARWWREQRHLPSVSAEHLVGLLEECDSRPESDESESLRRALRRCIKELDGRSRDMIHKRYAEGLDVAELARGLGRQAETVRTWLFRIRQALKACIERRTAAEEES